jgi:hypothetical protein
MILRHTFVRQIRYWRWSATADRVGCHRGSYNPDNMKEIEGQDIGATTVRRRWTAASARRVGNDGNFHSAAKDSVPSWLVMNTEKAVRQILRAVARGKPEAIITNHGKIAVAIERFAPWLIRVAGRKMNAAS